MRTADAGGDAGADAESERQPAEAARSDSGRNNEARTMLNQTGNSPPTALCT